MTVKDIEKLLIILDKCRTISGRTRFQKIIYLLQEKDKINMGYKFIPYHYGPYSSELQLEIDLLESAGLINVFSDNGTLYVHSLTPEGQRIAKQALQKMSPGEKTRLFESLKEYKRRPTSSIIQEAKKLAHMI